MANPKTNKVSFWLALCLVFFFIGMILHHLFFGRQAEGFVDKNPQLTYTPKKPEGSSNPSIQFNINDYIREAIEVPTCIKIYKRLPKPVDKDKIGGNIIARPEDEYANRPNTLDIYKKYVGMVEKENELMEAHFGSLFEKETIKTTKLNNYLDKFEKTMLAENKLHGFIKYTCIYPLREYPFTEFSDYFGKLVYRYKGREKQINEIKTFMYKLLWPIYLHSKFINHFKSNQSLYREKDDTMFVLNTTRDMLQKINIEDLPHRAIERNVYVFKDDKANFADLSLTVESLTLLTVSSMLYNIYSLTLPRVCENITIPRAELRKVFLDYLEIKFPKNKTQSVVAFLLDVNNDPALPE
jgi:hypothetical protein